MKGLHNEFKKKTFTINIKRIESSTWFGAKLSDMAKTLMCTNFFEAVHIIGYKKDIKHLACHFVGYHFNLCCISFGSEVCEENAPIDFKKSINEIFYPQTTFL